MKAYALIWVGMGRDRGTVAVPCDEEGYCYEEDQEDRWHIWFDREELRKLEESIQNDGSWEVLEIDIEEHVS